MKNTYGNNIAVTLFGESHGPAVGVVIDGLPAGVVVSEEKIREQLSRRRPSMATDTPRQEKDNFRILSGVKDGRTCGTPVTIAVPNENVRSGDYNYGPARPAHADYAAHVKYHGYEDYRGGGHFSARVTTGLVAAGGILLPLLESKGIRFGTHVAECAGIPDRQFAAENLQAEFELLKGRKFPVLDEAAGAAMQEKIIAASNEGDSVGGITETVITGVLAGLGEPWFDGLDCELGKVLFSIGAVKGVEFGAGFKLPGMRGSEANDPFRIVPDDGARKPKIVFCSADAAGGQTAPGFCGPENFEGAASADRQAEPAGDAAAGCTTAAIQAQTGADGKPGRVITETNNSGGINGGISNGMPVVFRCAFKPTPSISREQRTIDFVKCENINYSINGRHDPAVVRRACPIVEAAAAMVLCDMIAARFGTEIFAPRG